VEPFFPTAVLGAIVGLALYFRRRRREREWGFLREMALRLPHASLAGDAGGEIVVRHRGVPVTVGFGVPEGKRWERGLYARARYAIGAGPAFTAGPRDVSAHTRVMGGAYPLDVRFERGYDVTGDHREARALVLPTLARTDTRAMPAPLLSSDGEQLRVDLPEHVPDRADGERSFAQLVALTGELALFGQDLLERAAEQLDGSLVIDETTDPVMRGRYARGGIAGILVLRWRASVSGAAARTFSLTIEARRATSGPPDVKGALEALEPGACVVARQVLEHAELRWSADAITIELLAMPGPDELSAIHALLVKLASKAPPAAPFR
jgi:hypothetical protein